MSTLNTFGDFQFKKDFSALTAEEYQEAYDTVIAMWFGVTQLWGACDEKVRNGKRQSALALLIAWYLADMYPTRLINGVTDAGRPLSSKTMQQATVVFRNLKLPDAYEPLVSNQYGVKAAMMIHSAPEMMGIYGVQ